MEKRYPKFIAGAFIINNKGELFLRTTPSQGNRYTCINGKVEWGDTILQTLEKNIKEKTNLDVESTELIDLVDGLDIPVSDSETANMIFADYKVVVSNTENLDTDTDREYKWLTPEEWLKMDKDQFGPYVRETVEKLAK
jgi:ADP-ribose pyrophosphatase YjhB (NUDIX family)